MCLRAAHAARTQSHCSQMPSEGPSIPMSQSITSTQLHQLCRTAAGLFFPTCAHTHMSTYRTSRDTNRQPEQPEESQHQRSHCSTRSAANADGSSAICPSLDCEHHIPIYSPPAQSPKTLQHLNIHTLMG